MPNFHLKSEILQVTTLLLTVAVAIAAGHLVYQPKISIQPRSCTQMSGNDAWVPEILIEV